MELHECPVNIYHNGKAQTPLSLVNLIENSGKLDQLSLDIVNENGQIVTIQYRPTSDAFPHPTFHDNLFSSKLISQAQNCHFISIPKDQSITPRTLSLCSPGSISGLLPFDKNLFYVGVSNNQTGGFVLYPQTSQSCAFENDGYRVKRAAPNEEKKPGNSAPEYYSKYIDGKIRYVELALIADNSIYKKYDSDEEKVKNRLLSIENHIKALYYPLNIRISLVYTEIWSDKDHIEIEGTGDRALDNFLDYRKKLFKDHPHDNAHFLTNHRFEEGVVGKAFKGTMCSYDYSGGINVDHADNAAAVASTIAHEMGHNFGMEHDDFEVCACTSGTGACIMAAASGYIPHTTWSECSLQYLTKGFSRGVDLCLMNQPNITSTEAKCGNGIVETGEECDCGSAPCNNECCDEKTCQLKGEAKCASGDCCDLHTCQPKPRATICRQPIGICDLPEFCNGETNDCPADFFVQNGLPCPDLSDAHCYDGVCGSKDQQCQMIWGPDSKEGIKECYNTNLHGIFQGNCGYDPFTKNYTACTSNNMMCGRLQCNTKAERPIFGDSSSIRQGDSYVTIGREKHQCYVINSQYVGGSKNKKDPGMVPDGAVCGKDKICINTNCQGINDLLKITAKCKDGCHDRGICNNVGNCHCENGSAGQACEAPGYGGSVNSNPANLSRGLTPSLAFLIICALLGVLLAAVCIYYKVKKNRNLVAEFWKRMRRSLNLHGELVPIRKAPPPPGAKRGRREQDFSVIWNPANDGGAITVKPNFYANSKTLPPPPPVPTVPSGKQQQHSETYTFTAPASPLISPYHSDSSGSGPFSRSSTINKSDRPKVPPPSVPQRPRDSVIQKLYDEHGDEMGVEERIRRAHKDKPLPPIPIREDDELSSAALSRESGTLSRPNAKPPPPPKPSLKPALKK